MTLGNVREQGVRGLAVHCLNHIPSLKHFCSKRGYNQKMFTAQPDHIRLTCEDGHSAICSQARVMLVGGFGQLAGLPRPRQEANVLAIRDLVDKVAQHVFADLGTFLLDRTVKSFTDSIESVGYQHPAEKIIAGAEQRWAGKTGKLVQLENRSTRQPTVH